MKTRYVVLLVFINFILSSTLFQIFRINGALPNFSIIITVVLASLSSKRNAFTFALLSGAIQDVFLGRMLGINFLIYGLIVYISIILIEVMFKGNFLTPIFLIGLSTIFYHFIFYIIMFFVQSTIPLNLMYVKIISEVVMNSVLGTLIYSRVFGRVHGYKLG
ncbi:MAG TPA: rod shape-determining protein MreD, partial [Clostridiales bacterium UBA8960]|nr:rod shape-determining protein MreD [Clostridiales bacterium UBA8960]